MRNPLFSLFSFIIITYGFIPAYSQTISIDAIENSGQYIWGIGEGPTFQVASKAALDDLVNKLSMQVESSFTNLVKEEQGSVKKYCESIVKTYSSTTLQNTETKILNDSRGKSKVIRYLAKTDLNKVFSDRKDKVIEYTRSGIEAEKVANISDALRYYYWAYVLLRSLPDYNDLKFVFDPNKEITLMVGLPERITNIFSTLKIKIDSTDIRPNPYQKTLWLNLSYAGKEVQHLDYEYYTGQGYFGPVLAKDGLGIAELDGAFAKEATHLRISVQYDYANKAGLDSEVRSVMESINIPYFNEAEITLSLPQKHDLLTPLSVKPIAVKCESSINEIDNRIPDSKEYLDVVNKVVNYIESGQLGRSSPFFTPQGLTMFQQMMSNGNIRLLGQKEPLNVIWLGDEVMVRSVPMLFSYSKNKSQFVENVVFILTPDKKINSVSFALNDIAIRDIVGMPEGFGSREDKYKLIRFMEDYKTAYNLKRLDYIESIFADNALIIVGSVLKQYKPIDNMYLSLGEEKVKYNRLTKTEYIENLRRLFQRNEFVNLQFEDNIVRKTNGNEKIYGIQISQHYTSSSYSDKGYLFLMIDMNDSIHPKIYVRTWQPNKNPDGSIYGLEDFHL